MTDHSTPEDLAAVRALGETYARAVWSSDVGTLRSLFHPRANLYGVGDGGLEEYTTEDWLEIVAARPAAEGTAPCAIQAVDIPAPELASISVDAAARGRAFTDILSLLKINGTWVVIAKTFYLKGQANP